MEGEQIIQTPNYKNKRTNNDTRNIIQIEQHEQNGDELECSEQIRKIVQASWLWICFQQCGIQMSKMSITYSLQYHTNRWYSNKGSIYINWQERNKANNTCDCLLLVTAWAGMTVFKIMFILSLVKHDVLLLFCMGNIANNTHA